MDRVIVVESEDNVRKQLRARLEADGHEVTECANVDTILELSKNGADAVLLSSSAANGKSVDFVKKLVSVNPAAPIIVVSAAAEDALATLRAGAFYATRPPLSIDEISLLTGRALETTRPMRRSRQRSADSSEAVLIGEATAIRAIKDTIRRLRESPSTTVLVTGESGAGKDTVAHVIHNETHPDSPFVYVSPSALPEQSLESELFGVEATSAEPQGRPGLLERAHTGTLFLDEIADMPLSVQAKLLRFLQEKAFRRVGGVADRVSEARVIAASSRDLQAAVREGTVKAELLYRLAVVSIEVPPLRERGGDIPLLVRHFLSALSTRLNRPIRGVSDAAAKLLTEHNWPGNVRELGNVLERAALLSEADLIEASQLNITPSKASGVDYRLPSQGIDFRELEREVVVQALRHARGNQTRAASLLGMTRDQIRYRMAKFGMSSRGEPASRPGIRAA